MARPSLDEIFGAAPTATARPSLDEIFAAQPEPAKPGEQTLSGLIRGTRPEAPKAPEGIAANAFPRATREGASGLQRGVGAVLDAASLPGRALDAIASTEVEGNPYAAAMGGSFGLPKEAQRLSLKTATPMGDTEGKGLGRVLRDPALPAALATGGGALSLASRAGLRGLGAATAAGALEGAGSAAIHQADNAVQGREVSAGQAAAEVATSAALPGAAKVVGAIAKGGNKLLGKLAQEISGVSEEALRMHGSGFGAGAKALQEAAGKQHEIGQRIVKALDNLDDYLPEKDVVDQALQQMPAVNVANTIQRLQGAKTGGALSSSRATNAKIDELVSDLTGAADAQGNIPAANFRQIRKEIDELVGDAFGKESNKYVSALKEARHQMADDLTATAEASGRPEYVEAMRSMAQKLRKADDLASFLGKSAQTREQRAESFVANLFGKNKEERRRAVAAMGEIFGEDFLQEAKLASMAAELGEGGKASLMPRQFNGRSLLAPLAGGSLGYALGGEEGGAIGLALGSPRLASGALRLSGGAAAGLSQAGAQAALSGAARASLRPLFRGSEDRNP